MEKQPKGATNLKSLDSQVEKETPRNLNGSLEQCKEELRDAYMSFKDLQTRCVIDLKKPASSSDDSPVFYFKPETFLLDDPEKQRAYRSEILKQVGQVPKPDPITYLGDDLHREMCQTIADRSTPKQTKQILAEFFKRRQYSLQHMKYKLLCRWAHHNLTAEQAENIGAEAAFIFGKLEYNLEQSLLRNERLEQDDLWEQAVPEQRPSTKSGEEDGRSLYVEKSDLPAQSLIREDDVEVYMRGVSYRQKLTRVANKFISRLKWLPLLEKQTIFEQSIEQHFKLKQENIKRQKDLLDKVEEFGKKTLIVNDDFEDILNQFYCREYEKMFLNNIDRVIYSWKPNHDEVPLLIQDQFTLRFKILAFSGLYGLNGDIDLDMGYSFSYQVTTFLPGYFQRQVLKSQFSIYDSHVDDPQNASKRNLNLMTRIDTNIFRDVSTTKHTVPTDEAIQSELKDVDIKIMRLKSAAAWIDYVCLTANVPDWQQKQSALLSSQNPDDKLLKSAFNYLDVNDLATINRINEDNTQLHIKNVATIQRSNTHSQIVKKQIQTSDGEKSIKIDKMQFNNGRDPAAQLEHLISTVQPEQPDQEIKKPNSVIQLPAHLVTSYYTLRFVKSRDAKTRILYTLNYFRAIQKRLALDLREFATRDRIDAHFVNPFVHSREANHQVINQATRTAKSYEKVHEKDESTSQLHKMTVFDEKEIAKIGGDMASLRKYKMNGLFNNKVFTTSPSFPKYHSSHGEPLTSQPVAEQMDRAAKDGFNLTSNALKLMGRIEFIEINEVLREVYVKDDFGIYILYDCVLQDMNSLEEELLKVGSLYLSRSEQLIDPEKRAIPLRDRLELLHDLLEGEADFQFQKVKLCQVYMECYEHITDPLEQQKLMQVLTDIMARRPRFNLQANYFKDAYEAEVMCLKKQFEVVKLIVDLQISLEKTENKRLQDSLNLSYELANKYKQNQWKYNDVDQLLNLLSKRGKPKAQAQAEETDRAETHDNGTPKAGGDPDETKNSSIQQPRERREELLEDNIWGDSSSVSLDEDHFEKQDGNHFSKLLGLPTISLESIYQTYYEKDINIIKLMSEHSHFIQMHEGYPEFLTRLTHRSILDKNRLFKVNSWSQDTGSLDFYESMDVITRYHAVQQQCQQELYDSLKPWDATLMTQIDTQFAEMSLKLLRQVIQVQDGSLVEYEGRAMIEDEQVMGNADKMIFYAKEMLHDLRFKSVKTLNPFLVCKLDLPTINLFDFSKVPTELNKYKQERNGVYGYKYLMQVEKEAVFGIQKAKADSFNFADQIGMMLHGMTTTDQRYVEVPTQLVTYCNMMELARLRNELILAATETYILSQIYEKQCASVSQKNDKVLFSEGISFDQPEDSDPRYINYVKDGPAHHAQIGLAISEFDATLLSNMNFRHPDSFKLNILTAGLEEVRSVLHYQLMHKHTLIVAVRMNQLLIDSHERAISEITLFEKKIVIPNPVYKYEKMINKHTDSINLNLVKIETQSFKSSLSTNCLPVFYNILNKKSAQRATIMKDYASFLTNCQTAMPCREYAVQRIMRNYQLKLMTRFVQATLSEVYLDAQKVQAVRTCQRLRVFNRYLSFDRKVYGMDESAPRLKYESSQLLENYPQNYLPADFGSDEGQKAHGLQKVEIIKAFNSDYQIVDFMAIPSTASILTLESAPMEDLRNLKQKRVEIRNKFWGKEVKDDLKELDSFSREPETGLKELLPTFSPRNQDYGKKTAEEIDLIIKRKLGLSAGNLLDYEEALYFGDSKFAGLMRYYQSVERILAIELFLNKLQINSSEVIHLDQAIETGLPFWKPDGFDARIHQELAPKATSSADTTSRVQRLFYERLVSHRSKKDIAEVIQSVALTLRSFVAQYQKTKEESKFDYLQGYQEFRYQQVVGSLHKLVQQFYYQKNIRAVKITRDAISRLTKMSHAKVVYLRPNNYSVQTGLVSSDQYALDSGALIYGSFVPQDISNFRRCIQPVVNERALEPAQVTLFQSLYQSDALRKNQPSQFAGQVAYCQRPFTALETALLELNPQERVYAESFIAQTKTQANDFMETVFNDHSMATLCKEDCYSLSQLIDAKKFMNENTTALLLRNALICWYENRPMPDSCEEYERFESNFRQNFFWKQLEQKEILQKKLQQAGTFGQIPTKAELQRMKQKIDTLANDQNLATTDEVTRRDEIVKALQEEFSGLKKKVTLDNYFNMKAEIYVFQNEIEKFMIRASVQTLDSECLALSKCFNIQVPQIQYHIHPFQQFAATFFDQCDTSLHLDVGNRVTAVQVLLTKMRNRCTEVETLTSGPGLVFTVKDINELLQDFCRSILQNQEVQFKSRSELQFLMEENYRALMYTKDQQIKTLQARLTNIGINLENIIDARLFEKGNQLIYELDSSNRILQIFKQAYSSVEQRLVDKIYGEQMEKFQRQTNEIDVKNSKFSQYKAAIVNMINADWEADAERTKTQLKQKAEQAKITDSNQRMTKKIQMYPFVAGAGSIGSLGTFASVSAGAVVPDGFKHYPQCSCYQPNPNYPRPTLELAKIEMMTEREAREEVLQLAEQLSKQRVLFRTKELLMKTKYQDQINMMKRDMNSNATIWEQLQEAEKRERVLKQELLYTQQSLSASEKTILNLKEEIRHIDAERIRLQNFKSTQYQRLKELEIKNHKAELMEVIDTDKLLMALSSKDQQLRDLKSTSLSQQQMFEVYEQRRHQEAASFKSQVRSEQAKTQTVVEKMEQVKMELKMLESNDSSVASIWKRKCLDLYDVCQSLKSENDELRSRCKELIEQGIELAEAVDMKQLSSFTALPSLAKHDSKLGRVSFTTTKDKHVQSQASALNKQNVKSAFTDPFQKTNRVTGEMITGQYQIDQKKASGLTYGFDSQPVSQKKSGGRHDIKSMIVGPPMQASNDYPNKPQFQSNDKGFNSSFHTSSQQTAQSKRKQQQIDSVQESSTIQQPVNWRPNISFDLKGTAVAQQLGSPRQQATKQRKQHLQAIRDYPDLHAQNLILNTEEVALHMKSHQDGENISQHKTLRMMGAETASEF